MNENKNNHQPSYQMLFANSFAYMFLVLDFSLAYILNEMKPENHPKDNGTPRLFHIKLQLWENQLQYIPNLMNENDNNSFMDTIKRLIDDIYSVSSQIDKIAPSPPSIDSKRTYQSEFVIYNMKVPFSYHMPFVWIL